MSLQDMPPRKEMVVNILDLLENMPLVGRKTAEAIGATAWQLSQPDWYKLLPPNERQSIDEILSVIDADDRITPEQRDDIFWMALRMITEEKR